MTSLPPVLLIHGAWFGGWCWDRVAPRLRERGHAVFAPNLPGRPGNSRPEFPDLRDCVRHAIRVLLSDVREPCIVVGHSLGGATISELAESEPDRVRALVYVSAFLLQTGQAAVDLIRTDTTSLMRTARVLASDGRSSSLDGEWIVDALCGDCLARDVSLLERNLVPESTAIARDPVSWTEGRFGAVKRYFIECTSDRMVTPELQQRMYRALPCEAVVRLESAHAPFLTVPGELADAITEIATAT